MSLEQSYYELLTRTDHPVFLRDYSPVQDADSPFNSILNRVLARQMKLLRDDLEELRLNSQPDTCTALGIDQWEETYFGFTKPNKPLQQRRDELVIKRNTRITMSVPDAIKIAQSITGKTPVIIRSLFFGGWTLGQSVLGIDTILSGTNQAIDSQTYFVVFSEPVDSYLLAKLDEQLTKIEKAGSRHKIIAPPKTWIMGESVLGVDTLLG